jgi:hypothetical protein
MCRFSGTADFTTGRHGDRHAKRGTRSRFDPPKPHGSRHVSAELELAAITGQAIQSFFSFAGKYQAEPAGA